QIGKWRDFSVVSYGKVIPLMARWPPCLTGRIVGDKIEEWWEAVDWSKETTKVMIVSAIANEEVVIQTLEDGKLFGEYFKKGTQIRLSYDWWADDFSSFEHESSRWKGRDKLPIYIDRTYLINHCQRG